MDKQEKLTMHTANLADENFAVLSAMFPNAVTETITGHDENGEPIIERAIDADVLAQEINTHVVSGKEERYQFTWPEKKKMALLANAPVAATLRPSREESVDFDNTENLYIEGDNLDVLKLLRETYLNRVKMVYIDPPYNTGGDFLYPDNFDENTRDFLYRDNQFDDQGNRLITNFSSEGRFHTNWLNMLYPRLRVTRDLLTDDGVIFISIDDNEFHNLRKICDDVFGGANFINIITVKTKIGGVSGSSEGKSLKDATEFILVYAKNKSEVSLNPVYIRTPLFNRISSYLTEGKSWKYTSVMTKLEDKVLIKEDTTRGMKFWGYKVLETKSVSAYAKELGISEDDVYNLYADRIFQTTNAQSSVRQTVMKETEAANYPMFGCEYTPIKGKNEGQKIEILYKGEQRRMMMFLSAAVEKIDGIYYYMDKITSLWDDIEYNNLTKEGDMEFPNGKKPIKMLQRMINLVTDKDSLVLDFFSGSASTAHAVMQANTEDNGARRFILVQIPEKTDNEELPTICDIGKERMRRAGTKIKEEASLMGQDLDVGFRVLKLGSSNMKEVYYTPEEYSQISFNLDGFMDNIKPDRSDEDLMFQVMLDLGIPLSAKIEQDRDIFNVNDNYLIACFGIVDTTMITEIAQKKPYYAAFRDSSFANDSALVNVEQIFNTYSPNTIRKVL